MYPQFTIEGWNVSRIIRYNIHTIANVPQYNTKTNYPRNCSGITLLRKHKEFNNSRISLSRKVSHLSLLIAELTKAISIFQGILSVITFNTINAISPYFP